MNIYVAHSSSLPFKTELYQPIRECHLNDTHRVVLPHEDSDELFYSKEYFQTACELVVAEVSEPSTGLGIELGWADLLDVPIVCIHREGTSPSGSIAAVSDTVREYSDADDVVRVLGEAIETV